MTASNLTNFVKRRGTKASAKGAGTAKAMELFYAGLDDFIGWMESGGMIDRWRRRKEAAETRRNLRRLNRKIRETEAVHQTWKKTEERK
jgi:hypothetical protein